MIISLRPQIDLIENHPEHSLTDTQMRAAMDLLLSGKADEEEVGAFLLALKNRGETASEISVAAQVMRDHATRFQGPPGAIDTCGTGGDGAKTWNISTAVAFVLAGCEVPVAKHGNKAVSSASGSSDILSALGVNLHADLAVVQSTIEEIGIGFLFAQRHHPAMRHVAPIRAKMGVRTIFNVLGPLTNPAGAAFQLLGVYDQCLCAVLAQTLRFLGTTAAWVVHGSDGLDELTLTGPSHVAALVDGKITEFSVSPADFGLPECAPEALTGGDVQTNATAFRALLEGEQNAYRDIVLLNAAAGLLIVAQESDKKAAVTRAAKAIDNGAARAKLDALITKTNS